MRSAAERFVPTVTPGYYMLMYIYIYVRGADLPHVTQLGTSRDNCFFPVRVTLPVKVEWFTLFEAGWVFI